jgi:hypothetical protein
MLFIKYVSDKYGDSDDFAPPVTIPKGASFKDMVARSEHQRGARNRRQRHARTDARPRVGRHARCPERYLVWAQGLEGEYITAATIQP